MFNERITEVGNALGLKGTFLVDFGFEQIMQKITGGEEKRRAIYMLNVAAKYIKEHCPEDYIFYDDAKCDGYCVCDDCESAAAGLESVL